MRRALLVLLASTLGCGVAFSDTTGGGGSTSSAGGGAAGPTTAEGAGGDGTPGGGRDGAGGEGAGEPQKGSLILPENAGTVEAGSANSSPFGGPPGRYQQVLDDTLLTGLPKGAAIVGIRYRLDSGDVAFEPATLADLEIRLSTSKHGAGSLSTTFADNRGDDEVLARSGPLTIEPGDYPAG
ncbi:MAG: hypothetical protein KC731_01735, partial [Myxococcales bacterium]|nr:hypothetical protein [Myxococcales bacterium]